jgi:hypothetical protein
VSAGPWQLLIHDPGHGDGDPKWILATVASPGDIRPAGDGAADPLAVDDVTAAWVAARRGGDPAYLTRIPGATVWSAGRET